MEFDKKKEYGCYRVGAIVIDSASIKQGFPSDDYEPQWDEITNEYKDVYEIDVLEISDSGELKIESEHLDLLIVGERIYIDISEGEL